MSCNAGCISPDILNVAGDACVTGCVSVTSVLNLAGN